jgi:NADPH:quinone reductase-like Zn-dependent oxidoreductase
MKAVIQDRYGGPEHLRLADIPTPEPGKGQVRVRVLACAVNLSDWEYLVGSPLYARLAGGLFRPRRAVLGSDIAGVVDKLGQGVDEFALGDRIMGDLVMLRGGFAEHACVPAAAMIRVPDALSDEVAACLPQAGGIAVAGTEGVQTGERLLINGAGGGSGTMALQRARAAGAKVTAVDNAAKLAWLSALGAEDTIDYRVQDFAAAGRQWDRILDMVATRGPSRIAAALSPGGTYRAVGGGVGVLSGGVASAAKAATTSSSGAAMVRFSPSRRTVTVPSSTSLAADGEDHGDLAQRMLADLVVDLLVADIGLGAQPGGGQRRDGLLHEIIRLRHDGGDDHLPRRQPEGQLARRSSRSGCR